VTLQVINSAEHLTASEHSLNGKCVAAKLMARGVGRSALGKVRPESCCIAIGT
jgi:hypothetical protein